jgi:ABC-type nitrate/sulfonate/bicarbonate transport system substrate-binding protein
MKKCMVSMIIILGLISQAMGAEPLKPLTIQLDWFTNVQFAGILIAKDRGWYAEAGIDLTVKPWQKGISPIEEVASGRAQIGTDEGTVLIEARAAGKPLKAIGVQFQKSPLCLTSKKDKDIKSPKDLTGKKVGVSMPKTVLMTKIVLASDNIQYDQITPVQTGGNLDLLINDEVAAFAGFMNNQPLIMAEKGYETTYLPAFKYGYDFYSDVYFTTDDMIATQPDVLRIFMEVTLRGWSEVFKDIPAAAQVVVEKYHPDKTVSVTQQVKSLEIFKQLMTFSIGESLIGFMEEQNWQKGVDTLLKFGQIQQKVPAGDMFTLEFLKK